MDDEMENNRIILEQNEKFEWLVKFPDRRIKNFGMFNDNKLLALEYIYDNSICISRKQIINDRFTKIGNDVLEMIPTMREQVTVINKETGKLEFSREKFRKNVEINRNNLLNIYKRKKH